MLVVEGGYRFAVPVNTAVIGITPYAAIQAQNFHTPAYSETDLSGCGFGLSYNAMNGTDTRSELDGRFDDLTPNWSLIAKFDGEFASGSQFYAGSGTLRYTW